MYNKDKLNAFIYVLVYFNYNFHSTLLVNLKKNAKQIHPIFSKSQPGTYLMFGWVKLTCVFFQTDRLKVFSTNCQ